MEDQVQIFQIRSQINPLPANKGESLPCIAGCGEIMNNFHIFQCEVFNPEEKTHIEKLINGDIYEMKQALNKWNQNLKKIEEITQQDSF